MSNDDSSSLYDPRNHLNDLNSKEWTYALSSVLSTHYPARGTQSLAHNMRRQHPSPKPPQLLAELIRFFTKQNGRVLDPFCGTGSSLLACSMTQRRGVGFDLSPTYRALYHEVAQSLDMPVLPYYIGDSSDAATFLQSELSEFDFVIADPPYLSMLNKKRTGHRAKKGQSESTPFSDNQHDLGNMSTEIGRAHV